MFAVNCPRHASRVLLFSDDIEALVDGPTGIDLHWRCRCGATGVLHYDRDAAPDETRHACTLSC